MPTIGVDCSITLAHDSIAGGNAAGFILAGDSAHGDRGPAISVQRQVDSLGNVEVHIFFSVLAAPQITQPNGKVNSTGWNAWYSKLVQYLAQISGLTLATPIGVFSNLGAIGLATTEIHYGSYSVIACQLNNAGVYFPPAGPDAFYNSIWDGSLTWETSYWR